MEFKIKKTDLVEALTKVQGITGKKTNIPITSNVIVSAKENKIFIIATDLEIAFQGQYKAEILKEGICGIPSRKFYEIVREFPSKYVLVKELDNKWIRIANEKVEYNIVGIETEEFPKIPDIEGTELFDLEVDTLRDMIEKTMYAVLADEGRVHLTGIFFKTIREDGEKMLRMVSTDGHRLSLIDYPTKKTSGFSLNNGVIIPKNGVVEVLKILEEGETVQIGIKDNNFVVKKDFEGIVIRLIEGEFPDYNLVIPKKNKNKVTVDKESLLNMLRRMSILSSSKYRSVRCTIGNEQMETVTTNPEIGESRETIPIKYKGEVIEMAFNPRYVIEATSAMKSEEVVMRLNDGETPCLIQGKKDPGFLSVVMPMRI